MTSGVIKSQHGVKHQDYSVMDNVIISCTVGGEEALVDKACSCTCRKIRLVRQKMLIVTKQSEKIDSNLSKCHFYVAVRYNISGTLN